MSEQLFTYNKISTKVFGEATMKRITMTFSVFIEDDYCEEEILNRHENIVLDYLYDHICDWEGNTEGTVDVLFSDIESNVEIGDADIYETVLLEGGQ